MNHVRHGISEKDAKLLAKLYLHYQFENNKLITIEASELDVDGLTQEDLKIRDLKPRDTLYSEVRYLDDFIIPRYQLQSQFNQIISLEGHFLSKIKGSFQYAKLRFTLSGVTLSVFAICFSETLL